MVHDELVIQCPKRFVKEVVALIQDAFMRAAVKMKHVKMMSDYHVADHWQK